MKKLIAIIISGALVVSGYAQTRNVLVGTNNNVVQPTNFWSADASNARAGLGLGTAATNPASAFQQSSTVLSNLASSNAVNLTNLQASSVTGAIAISNGGSGATTAGGARTNLGLGATWLTNTEASNFRTAIGLGTNAQPVFDGASITGDLFAGSLEVAAGSNSTAVTADGIEFTGGHAATTRTNLGLGLPALTNTNVTNFRTAIGLGATWLTNTAASNFRTAIGLGAFQSVEFAEVVASTALEAGFSSNTVIIDGDGINFGHSGIASTTRTNLGLGWSALTNTNAGTRLVSVNTNGEVVSPTNFWQMAPISTNFTIQTLVQDLTVVVTSQTNNATNARNLYVYSLATNVSGISNTIILPTNAATLNGDEATVIHKGTTNTATVIRQAGSTNNLITLSRFDESVKFIRELGQWDFYHNISFVEPIQFSGTNASASAAASRTNLGLGATNDVEFSSVFFGVSLVDLEQGVISGFNDISAGTIESVSGTNRVSVSGQEIEFAGISAATTRTNLGLGATWLTNTNVTNFRTAIGVSSSFGSGVDSILMRGSNNYLSIMAGGLNSIAISTFNAGASGTNSVAIGADGIYSTGFASLAIGGQDLNANGNFSFASGFKSDAVNTGSFVWHSGNGLETNRFASTNDLSFNVRAIGGMSLDLGTNGIIFRTNASADATRTNLGLGGTNIVTFAGLTNNGDITINQTTATNGLLFIRRTNNEAFLGMANLVASNNTNASNETLFRVGVAEATNKSAQFGFRSTNANGNGVAVFSVFGYNALMMIGPSDPAAGTNPIEATVYSVSPANKVMTLIKTNTGATLFHRAIEFENTTNQAVTRTNLGLPLTALTNDNTTNFQAAVFQTNTAPVSAAQFGDRAAWMEVNVITNGSNVSFRIPLYK